MESFLYIATTFIVAGERPVENEMLNVSTNPLEISFLSSFIVSIGMLLDPSNLFESIENIIFCIYDFVLPHDG